MTRISLSLVLLAACGSAQSTSAPPTGQDQSESTTAVETSNDAVSAESWTLKDLNGTEVSLASYQGKTVVLEWFSPTCPFMVYAHGEGPLKDMASRVTANGDVAWLAINSSAAGDAADLSINQQAVSNWNISNPVLLDRDGAVGRMYGAKSTPHMFVLNGEGEVIYKGALDNAPRGEGEGEYLNYVEAALADLAAGRPVATAETKAYGCGVKY